jgi:hypothetical protein
LPDAGAATAGGAAARSSSRQPASWSAFGSALAARPTAATAAGAPPAAVVLTGVALLVGVLAGAERAAVVAPRPAGPVAAGRLAAGRLGAVVPADEPDRRRSVGAAGAFAAGICARAGALADRAPPLVGAVGARSVRGRCVAVSAARARAGAAAFAGVAFAARRVAAGVGVFRTDASNV